MTGRAARLGPVVAARRAADQGRLAACLARQRARRIRAAGLLCQARAAPAGGDGADMALTAHWQDRLRAMAAALRAEADALEPEAARLRARLARSLGREQAVGALAEAEHADALRRAERRAEDTVPTRQAAPAAGRDMTPGSQTETRARRSEPVVR